jgi:hypothetical protein
MPAKTPKILIVLFVFLSLMMVFFLFLGMIANTKTVGISKSMTVTLSRLKALKKENKELELYILREHTPAKIRHRAETKLNLGPPSSIQFFSTNRSQL